MWSFEEFKSKVGLGEIPEHYDESKFIHFFWAIPFKVNHEDAWFYLADTSRFNRELQFAKRKEREENSQLVVETTMLGLSQEWVEEPWSWVTGKTLTNARVYRKGMCTYSRGVFHVEPTSNPNECIVYVVFSFIPKNELWKTFLKLTMPLLQKNFLKVFAKIEKHFQSQPQTGQVRLALAQKNSKNLLYEELRKLETNSKDLLGKGLNQDVVEKLTKFVLEGDDMEVERIRVPLLAKKWKVNKKDLLVTCLHATRIGMLNISWDVICPHCRGVRLETNTLGDLPKEERCAVCAVDFSTDRLDSIEVTFHVHPSIRKIEKIGYCVAEPTKKEHIKIQQTVEPGNHVNCSVRLREGRHRFRKIGSNHSLALRVLKDAPDATITWDGTHSPIEVIETGPKPKIIFKNPGETRGNYVLEELWWDHDSLRPVELFTLQEFRDLFSQEHLSADVKLSLGQQTILFTDMVGSTKFYQAVGDARAFKDVRQHFVEVFSIVKKHNGAVVKTIGDAVMAAFHTPEEALEASIDIQQCYHEYREDTPVRLRISIHTGSVIAVHLHQGVDYFGGTVNMAAKLQACAETCEIAMSPEVFKICSISYDKMMNYPLTKKQAPTMVKPGVPLEAYVIKVERRKGSDRRKSA